MESDYTEIKMLNLKREYDSLKSELDAAISAVLSESTFINGRQVSRFCNNLSKYLGCAHVIPCANGTDAIRLSLQALGIGIGDEVIMPAFTFISASEMMVSLGAEPILIDVDTETFNLDARLLEKAISRKTKAILVVHLFGQVCDMDSIMRCANRYKIPVIEDVAQSLGAEYRFPDGQVKKAGTIGLIGTTSFFPSKPLGCYGDGGAVVTSDVELATQIRMLANHGQSSKYIHKYIGSNSRLDTLQAAILDIKLRYINQNILKRQELASTYDSHLNRFPDLITPARPSFSSHVYHQYVLRVLNSLRDPLRAHLSAAGIETAIHYPRPIHEQEAYKWVARVSGDVSISASLSREVLSLPIHSELEEDEQRYIIDQIFDFYLHNKKI